MALLPLPSFSGNLYVLLTEVMCHVTGNAGLTMNKEEFNARRLEHLGWLQEWSGTSPAGGPLDLQEHEKREYRTHTEIKITYDGEPGERIPA